ncbi:MAG TPA: SusC/RagA family TonB-linked outer membrane protein [Cyclobacteriaceae bacterium]|nr:SusC/RagA family TonB-linked outer membrane protein [Cyclobacteriaceae bacterium]
MRITLVHIILTSISITFANAVDTMGQEILSRKVTIDVESEEFQQALMLISEQTKVKFAYSPELIEDQKKVTLHLKEAELSEVLSALLGPDINYKVIGKRIVLSPVSATALDEPDGELNAGSTIVAGISGTVTEQSGAPMPGVSIVVKGTTVGTTTDTNGKYSIQVAGENDILIFSFIGYATQEVLVGSQTTINVTLLEDATQLSEVVVTALGIERQAKTLVYATQSVNPSQLTEVRDANNIMNSFQGKIANAQITQGSGGPGSGARIVLRGNRSIQGSNNALIVVDGVPINNDTRSAAGSDFGSVQSSDGASNINPDDIESVTILRGASAAALYGSAAGNGVIVITTKKGTKDKMSVTVNSGITAEQAFVLPDVQNKYGQGNAGILNTAVGDSWGARMEGQAYTNHLGESRSYSSQSDNIKDFFRTGISLNNSIGVQGGSEKMQTYLSYTNNQVQGIVPDNDLTRHTINLRLSNQISKKLSTDAKITYISQDITNRPRTGEENAPVIDIYQAPRSMSLSDIKNFEYINNVGLPTPTPWPSTLSSIYQNPYWMINRTAIDQARNRVMGFVTAKYDILDNLSITGRANLDKTYDLDEQKYSQGTILWVSQPGGFYSRTNTTTTQQWYDVTLAGQQQLGSDLKLDYRAGAIFQDYLFDQSYAEANGLYIANKFSLGFAGTSSSSQSSTEVQTQSVFGQVSLAYKEVLFLEGSIRNDWDSRLPSPYSIPYPSVGLSGIISDMVALPGAISFLKLNANYAVVGNGGQAQVRTNTYSFSQGAGNGFLSRSATEAIPGIKFELVKNLEFGVDARFLDNRLGFTFTYYKSNSTNQLLKLSQPVATGYNDKYINAGDIQNSGIELVLNATPVKQGAFTWDLTFNLGINRNKIKELSPEIDIAYLSGNSGYARTATPVIQVGKGYGDMVSRKWQRDDNGNFVVDKNSGLPVATPTQEYLGSFMPKATMGLTNSITYKNFSLRLLIDGRSGGVILDGTEMNLAFSGISAVTEKNREEGWNLGGVDAEGNAVNQPVTAQQFWTAGSESTSGKRYGIGEFFAYDATNFRIRELSIGYNIPVPANFFIKSARFSLVARNLAWIYRGSSLLDIPGLGKRKLQIDPDMSLGNGNWQGVQYGSLPSTRSLGCNLNLTF